MARSGSDEAIQDLSETLDRFADARDDGGGQQTIFIKFERARQRIV